MKSRFNKYVENSGNADWKSISPDLLGVLFTMIQIKYQQPISTQQQYIEQVKRSGVATLDTFIRENKTIYADAPEYGVPVVLKRVSGKTYEGVQDELEELTSEIVTKVGI